MTDITQTPEFKRWFGKSKVVDANGNPLRVYHGTANGQEFSSFDIDRSELGAHFGTSGQANELISFGVFAKGSKARVYPCYLRILNPLRLKDNGEWGGSAVVEQLWDLGMQGFSHLSFNKSTDADIRKAIQAAGYDGIVYLNRCEASGRTLDDLLADSDYMEDDEFLKVYPKACFSWIIFSPTQVKSAIGNKGTYNRKHADIGEGLAQKVLRITSMNQDVPGGHA